MAGKRFFPDSVIGARLSRRGGNSNAIRALALGVLSWLAACSAPPPPEPPPRPVRIVRAELRQTSATVRYSGDVRARYETPMAFQVGGKIDRRLVEVGATVRKGQLLLSLEPSDYQYAESAAKARLAALEAQLSQARQDLKHLGVLRNKALSSPAAVDRRQAEVRAAEARVAEAQADLAVQTRRRARTELRAGYDGVVTALTAESGQVVAEGGEVLRLARLEHKEVVIAVPENRLDELRNADAIRVSLWARPGEFLPGKVREISPGAEAVTRTFTVKVALPTAGPEVRLGLTATVHVDHAEPRPVARLPSTAVTAEGGQTRVWVLDTAGKTVHPRAVVVAGYDDDQVKVVAGLMEGEQVVTAGVHKLLDGQKVRILDGDRPSP